MTDTIETALLALADLIRWEFYPAESSGECAYWSGKGATADYGICCPPLHPNVDANPERHFSLLDLSCHNDISFERLHIPTVAEAKRLCANHALNGDLSEIEAVHAAAEAQNLAFKNQRLKAQTGLYHVAKAHKPPHLKWRSEHQTMLQWTAKGKRGFYVVCFTPEERWTVTVTQTDDRTEPQRFLTLDIAQQACRLHSHTGQWLGVI